MISEQPTTPPVARSAYEQWFAETFPALYALYLAEPPENEFSQAITHMFASRGFKAMAQFDD